MKNGKISNATPEKSRFLLCTSFVIGLWNGAENLEQGFAAESSAAVLTKRKNLVLPFR
jgi:hypothetical protein